MAELPVPSGGPGPDRTPPQDIAAEQSVLGAMLLSKDAIADVVETLREADFYRPAHASVYAAILDLYGRGEPADAVTVAAELTRTGDLGRIGGAPYLHTLVSMVPTAANAGYYARIVQERAVMRRLVEAGTRIVQLGYTAEGDVDQVVDRAQAEVYDVTDKRTSEDYLPLRDIMDGALNEIEAISNRGGQMVGVPTGFADLDSLTNGLHPGQLVVVAARPAIGKCLAASSMVVDARTGDRMTIADFVACGQRGETRVIHTLDEHWRLRAVEPSDFLDNGIRRVFRLQLQSGRRVRATGHHPLRTLAGWVPLEELRPGDRVAVPRPSTPREGWSYAAVPDTLPAAAWEYVDKARGERSWAEVAAIAGLPGDVDWSAVRGDDLPRKIVGDLAEAFDDDDLRLLHDADVVWDRVVSVRPDGHDRVYDLTVDGTHNFVADDVVVHNSTLGLDFTRAASIKHGLTSVIFSLEMSRNEIVMRLLSAEAQVALHHMRSGSMGDSDWQKLAAKMGAVSDAPLFIDDSPNMTMMEIRAKCRRLKQRHDLRLVVVDYLQLMTSGKRVESRQQEVAEFSRSLKLLAKELEVPVIAISQLNRGPEQRQDKKPMLSDLRESGSIEQDADVVILLNREDAYERESPRAGEADFIVAKHRNGPTATVTVAFQGHYSRFVDMAQM
ncbi:MAG: replicative DNA helicase [Candidatus Nanopelagicales bacterium]